MQRVNGSLNAVSALEQICDGFAPGSAPPVCRSDAVLLPPDNSSEIGYNPSVTDEDKGSGTDGTVEDIQSLPTAPPTNDTLLVTSSAPSSEPSSSPSPQSSMPTPEEVEFSAGQIVHLNQQTLLLLAPALALFVFG